MTAVTEPARVDVRIKLLRAATEVLTARGFEGLTISSVARAAGLSRPTVYAHFGTLEHLVSDTLTMAVTDAVGRVVARARHASSGAEFVVETVIALRGEFRRQPALAPLAFPHRTSTSIFDGDALGPESLEIARGLLRPLLEFHPELEAEMGEVTETMVRFVLSLAMFESKLSASDAQLRGYLHRRLVPALGLPRHRRTLADDSATQTDRTTR